MRIPIAEAMRLTVERGLPSARYGRRPAGRHDACRLQLRAHGRAPAPVGIDVSHRFALTVVWPLVAACVLATAAPAAVSAQNRYPESYLRYAGDPQKRGEAAGRTPPAAARGDLQAAAG